MKILIVANHILGNDLGSGGDRLFLELTRRWQQWGHHVHVLVAAAGQHSCAHVVGATNVTVLPGSWLDAPQRYRDRPLLVALVYLVRSVRALYIMPRLTADIVYTPGDFWCDVLPAAVKKIQQPNLTWAAAIFHINEAPHRRRGNSLAASVLSWLAQRVSFWLIKRTADVVFPLNSSVRTALITRGWPAQKLHVHGAGLDVEKFTKIPSRPKRFTACYLGRINPTKGVFDLPAIWAMVVEKIPDSSLIVMGGGSPTWDARLRQAIADAGVMNKVRALGFVPSSLAYRHLKDSTIFISASTEEGFGISAAEAMACGVPVVAYDLPAYREFFPQGMTRVPVGDTRAFADAVVLLLTDPKLYHAQRTAALATAARLDWDQVARAELAILERVRSAVVD